MLSHKITALHKNIFKKVFYKKYPKNYKISHENFKGEISDDGDHVPGCVTLPNISEATSLGRRVDKALAELERGKYRCLVDSETEDFDEDGGDSPPRPDFDPPDSRTELNASLQFRVQQFDPTFTHEHLSVNPR